MKMDIHRIIDGRNKATTMIEAGGTDPHWWRGYRTACMRIYQELCLDGNGGYEICLRHIDDMLNSVEGSTHLFRMGYQGAVTDMVMYSERDFPRI